MNVSKYLGILAAIILSLPLAAFAKENNEGRLQLSDPVEIGSTRLEAGSYKVEWNGAGPTVQINILQGNKTVATTSGRIVELQRPSSYDDVVLKPVANGNVKTIDEIDFNNRKEGLRLTPNMLSQR
jgi:hypothetical protein